MEIAFVIELGLRTFLLGPRLPLEQSPAHLLLAVTVSMNSKVYSSCCV